MLVIKISTYDREIAFIGYCFLAVIFKQDVLGLEVCVCQFNRVQKLYRLKSLYCYFSNLVYFKAFVAIVFDEVVQTLSERFKHKAHVVHISVALFRLISEGFFQMHYTSLTTALLLKALQDLSFKLCTLRVAGNCANHLYCVGLLCILERD